MNKNLFLIYNANLVDANITIKNGAILLDDSSIAGFPSKDAVKKLLEDETVAKFDAQGRTLMPGFIDMHAHFRDPGLTHKEDIETGSLAAAAGGFTTLVLMPNTSPVVSSQEAAVINNSKATAFGYTKVIQSVSITKDFDGKTISHLESLDSATVPLITEDGKEVTDSSVMFDAMKIAAEKNIIVSCHCEDPSLAAKARPYRMNALRILEKGIESLSEEEIRSAENYLTEANKFLAAAEDSCTYRNIELAAKAGAHVHICHVSTRESIELVRRARAKGYDVTCEVTPHHIGLSGEKSPGIFNIVNPPLRTEDDRLAVIEALKDGTADAIATDHAPHTAEDKKNGSPGFSGLETAFAVCNTILCKKNSFTLNDLSRKMSLAPAQILGLKKTGLLKEGYAANLVLVDENKTWTVCGEEFASKGKFTPLEGKELTGQVEATFFNGKIVFQNQDISNNSI